MADGHHKLMMKLSGEGYVFGEIECPFEAEWAANDNIAPHLVSRCLDIYGSCIVKQGFSDAGMEAFEVETDIELPTLDIDWCVEMGEELWIRPAGQVTRHGC